MSKVLSSYDGGKLSLYELSMNIEKSKTGLWPTSLPRWLATTLMTSTCAWQPHDRQLRAMATGRNRSLLHRLLTCPSRDGRPLRIGEGRTWGDHATPRPGRPQSDCPDQRDQKSPICERLSRGPAIADRPLWLEDNLWRKWHREIRLLAGAQASLPRSRSPRTPSGWDVSGPMAFG
jgi:hypothetical protein